MSYTRNYFWSLVLVSGSVVFASFIGAAAIATCVGGAKASPAAPPIITWDAQGTPSLPEAESGTVQPKTPARPAFSHPTPSVSGPPPTPMERGLVETAMARCNLSSPRRADPWAILRLIRLAQDDGLPMPLWPILPAIWCGESAWGWGDEIRGDGGLSHGPLQLQTTLASMCGDIDLRDDLMWSARCWLHHIRRVSVKVRSRCRGLSEVDALLTAEAWVAGGLRYAYRCRVLSGHGVRAREWFGEAYINVLVSERRARQCQER